MPVGKILTVHVIRSNTIWTRVFAGTFRHDDNNNNEVDNTSVFCCNTLIALFERHLDQYLMIRCVFSTRGGERGWEWEESKDKLNLAKGIEARDKRTCN
jgi:hypothetical protein